VDRGFLCRLRATDDRRHVLVKLTREGEKFLEGLSLHHLQELQSTGPKFVKILQGLIGNTEALSTDETKKTVPGTRDKRRKDTRNG
jgi:DNA-binding MarR family transcriptional regulator